MDKQLKHKVIHLINGESVIVCSGVTLSDDQSTIKNKFNYGWCFIEPETPKSKRKQSRLFKEGSNHKSLDALKSYIEEAGYIVPEAFGYIGTTDTTSISVKRSRLYVRVGTSKGQLGFSFQYQPNSPVSFHDAMENAIRLRDSLWEFREERQQLLDRVGELEPVIALLKD